MQRRYYVTSFDVMHAHKDLMGKARATYLTLEDGMVLVSAKLHSEAAEDLWHDHPEVTLLPDPVFNGTAILKDYLATTKRAMRRSTSSDAPSAPDAFTALAAVGVADTDTVLDLETKVRELNPGMRLRSIL